MDFYSGTSEEKQESQHHIWARVAETGFLVELAEGPKVRVSPGGATRKQISTKRLLEQASSTPPPRQCKEWKPRRFTLQYWTKSSLLIFLVAMEVLHQMILQMWPYLFKNSELFFPLIHQFQWRRTIHLKEQNGLWTRKFYLSSFCPRARMHSVASLSPLCTVDLSGYEVRAHQHLLPWESGCRAICIVFLELRLMSFLWRMTWGLVTLLVLSVDRFSSCKPSAAPGARTSASLGVV